MDGLLRSRLTEQQDKVEPLRPGEVMQTRIDQAKTDYADMIRQAEERVDTKVFRGDLEAQARGRGDLGHDYVYQSIERSVKYVNIDVVTRINLYGKADAQGNAKKVQPIKHVGNVAAKAAFD